MGWFWGASAPAKTSSISQDPTTAQASPQPTAQAPKIIPPPQAEDDAEVHKFLEEIMGEVKNMRDAEEAASSPPSNQRTPPNPLSTWASRWSSSSTSGSSTPTTTTDDFFPSDYVQDNPNNEPRLSPLAESLLPTTMNCEQAFNQAFYCQSLGGQWHHLYRYGSIRSCGEQWDDWFFCMRAKGTPPGKVKNDMIRDHYRRKLLAKYGPGKPSSEDVWRERRERVRPDEAFATQPEAAQVSDAEYQKWEMERIEMIRKRSNQA